MQSLPVSVDANCSGLQILSILIGDSKESKVNVIPEAPQDIYTIIASKVETEVRQVWEWRREVNRWFVWYFSNSQRNIMTYVYGLRPHMLDSKFMMSTRLNLVKNQNV